jgi:hypothetical protein
MTIRSIRIDESQVAVDVLRRSFTTVAERFGLTMENCPRNIAFYTEQRFVETGTRTFDHLPFVVAFMAKEL